MWPDIGTSRHDIGYQMPDIGINIGINIGCPDIGMYRILISGSISGSISGILILACTVPISGPATPDISVNLYLTGHCSSGDSPGLHESHDEIISTVTVGFSKRQSADLVPSKLLLNLCMSWSLDGLVPLTRNPRAVLSIRSAPDELVRTKDSKESCVGCLRRLFVQDLTILLITHSRVLFLVFHSDDKVSDMISDDKVQCSSAFYHVLVMDGAEVASALLCYVNQCPVCTYHVCTCGTDIYWFEENAQDGLEKAEGAKRM